MANWLNKILGAGVTEGIRAVGEVMEKHTGKKERDIAVGKMLVEQANAQMALIKEELGVRERIMVAELTQDDKYTKRARPTIVYVGLLAMIVDGVQAIPFIMPEMFWDGWMVAVSVWAVGRTAEKIGAAGKLGDIASMITGGKKRKQTSLLED